MVVIGIDPGVSGALCWMSANFIDNPPHVAVLDMPTVERTVNKRTRQVVDPAAVWGIVKRWAWSEDKRPKMLAALEYVGPMPGEGTHSAFVFGRYLGYCEMALTAASVPWEYVTPLAWKREFGLVGKPKDESRLVAQRLFPEVDLSKKKHHGRADALLIAEWGRRQLAKRGEPRVV